MAQWDSSGFNTDKLSMLFNRILNNDGYAFSTGGVIGKTLKVLMGEMISPADIRSGKPAEYSRVVNRDRASGNRIEVQWETAPSAYSASTDGTTALTPSDSNRFGNGAFDYTHYVVNEHVQKDIVDRSIGAGAKGVANMMDKYAKKFARNVQYTLALSIAGSGNNALTNAGGVFAACSASLTYGGLTRNGSTNTNLRSYSADVSGAALSLGDINLAQTTVRDRGGSAEFAFCDLTTLKLIRSLVETQGSHAFGYVSKEDKASIYGAAEFCYNGTWFVGDSLCPVEMVAFVSPEYWEICLSPDNFMGGQWILNPGTESSYVYKADYYAANICTCPWAQGVLLNVER